MSPHTVSVVISPPTVDLDSYEPFDEEYIRTVDEILSDEPSFDASFDAYNGGVSMDGANDSPPRERGTGRASVGKRIGHAHKKSPYFSTGQMSQRRVGSKRRITRIDVDEGVEDKDDDEGEEEDDDEDDLTPDTSVESVKIQGTDSFLKIQHDNNSYAKVNGKDALDDDAAEEAIVFASVQPEAQARMLDFIASHPFMRGGSYPVRRTKRRTFVCELYEQAKSAGMDEPSFDRLTNYVRKTYLELYGEGYVDTQGSEFGDEIDDVAEERRRSSKVCKKDRKRKRSNGDTVKGKSKKRRSKTSEDENSHLVAGSHNDAKREVIDLEAESPLEDSFASVAAEPEVLESVSPAEELPNSRRPSISKQSDRSSKDGRSNSFSFVTPDTRNNRTSVLTSKHALRSPANSQDEPICLISDSDGAKESARAAPVAHLANPIPSDKPESRNESIARPKKQRNSAKRRNRRKRRAEKIRESLRGSEIQELAANDHNGENARTKRLGRRRNVRELAADDRHIEEDATTKEFDLKNGSDMKVEKDVTILDDPFWTLDF